MTNSLDFLNGKIIYFFQDGEWWFHVASIATALGIPERAVKRVVSSHPALVAGHQNLVVQIGEDQPRLHMCISERRVYMLLAVVKAKTPELIKYQLQLADMIYDQFKGQLAPISAVAIAKKQDQIRIAQLESELGNDPRYIELVSKRQKVKGYGRKITTLAAKQADLFN